MLNPDTCRALKREAAQRGMTITMLIARDGLVDAVLDDRDEFDREHDRSRVPAPARQSSAEADAKRLAQLMAEGKDLDTAMRELAAASEKLAPELAPDGLKRTAINRDDAAG